MFSRNGLAAVGCCLALGAFLTGCIGVGDVLNPEFLSALGGGQQVAMLPDEAPGLLVSVENRTTRAAKVVVSYRDGSGNVEAYTTYVDAGDASGQMLICPVDEITLGSVTDLGAAGARVALVDGVAAMAVDNVPFIDVEPFGVLLRDEVNYDCGDSLLFVVRTSGVTRSGFETIAYVRRSAAPNP